MTADPMFMPVLVSTLATDWIFKNHDLTDEVFKAAMFTHKIYEDASVSEHM